MSNNLNGKQAAEASSVLLGVLNEPSVPACSKGETSNSLLSLLNQPLTQTQGSELEPTEASTPKQVKPTANADIQKLLFPAVTPYSEATKKKPKSQRRGTKRGEGEGIEAQSFVVSSPLVVNEINASGTNFSHVSPFDQIPTESEPPLAATGSANNPKTLAIGRLVQPITPKTLAIGRGFNKAFNESHIAKVPHDSGAESRKSIIAQQGFAGYSVKGGKIRVLKELAGTMVLLREHQSTIVDLKFWDPENAQELDTEVRYLISISLDSTLLLWCFKNVGFSAQAISYTVEFGLQGTPSQGSTHRYRHLAWNPANMDIIAVATDSNSVLLIDISTYMKPNGSALSSESELGNMITEVKVDQPVSSLAFSLDGKHLAVGESGGRILLVELDDATICGQRHLPTAASGAVSFLSFLERGSGGLLVGSGGNTEIQLRDINSESVLQTLMLQPPPSGAGNGLCYERSSGTMFLGCQRRRSLLAFHILQREATTFDFVSEYTVPEAILDVEATLDILTSKAAPSKRSISLYTSQDTTKSMFVIPVSHLYPETPSAYPLFASWTQQRGLLSVPQGRGDKFASKFMAADVALLTELFSSDTAATQPKAEATPAPFVQEDGSLSLDKLFLAHESISKPKSAQAHPNLPPKAEPQVKVLPSNHLPSLNRRPSSKPHFTSDSEAPTHGKPTLSQGFARNSEDVSLVIKREVSGVAQQSAKDMTKLGAQLAAITRDMKSLPAALNQTIANGISNTMRECTQAQIPQILDERFAIAFNQFLDGKGFRSLLEHQLKKHILEALTSSNITAAIGEAVSDQLAKGIQKVVAAQFETVLIPAYEAASAKMFQQLHQTFSDGLKKIHEGHEALLALQQAQLSKTAELLAAHKPTTTSAPSQAEASATPIPRESAPQKQEPKADPKPAAQPEPRLAEVITPPSFELEERILEALTTSDHKRLVLLFDTADPATVFKYCGFPQKSMLILAKLMTKELGARTDLKLAVIQECLRRLAPKDPSISEHIGRFIATIKSSLSHFSVKLATSDPGHPALATVRTLMDSCATLLASK
ncbi:enhancer of mRNA decapping 4 [Massospora cicadina]|nr:enhancer of mRNA decapping 4 [Massospora cicadina]